MVFMRSSFDCTASAGNPSYRAAAVEYRLGSPIVLAAQALARPGGDFASGPVKGAMGGERIASIGFYGRSYRVCSADAARAARSLYVRLPRHRQAGSNLDLATRGWRSRNPSNATRHDPRRPARCDLDKQPANRI